MATQGLLVLMRHTRPRLPGGGDCFEGFEYRMSFMS